MYLNHFELSRFPFMNIPDTSLFFEGGKRRSTIDSLIYALTSGEGIIKVVGEVGSGKTTVCHMLQQTLPDNMESILISTPLHSAEEMLLFVASKLNLDDKVGQNRLIIMDRLQETLMERRQRNQSLVVLIDEAQCMSINVMEEIRLLSNLETNNGKLLQLVLFGQPELDQTLSADNMRQFRDRICHSLYLPPLSQKEIGHYLHTRLRHAGYLGMPLFSPRSVVHIYRASGGLIRKTNMLAHKSLLAAYGEGDHVVQTRHVKAAIRDSLLPTHKRLFRLFWPLIHWFRTPVIS